MTARQAVQVYTDGSSLGNPGPGGWAWWRHGDCWRAGGLPHTTNQQAELIAVLMALKQVPTNLPLDVVSDSQYAVNAVTKWIPQWRQAGWRTASGNPVQNLKLMQHLEQAMKARGITATVRWVRGHNGVLGNEHADRAAVAAAYAIRADRMIREGPGWTAKPAPKSTPAPAPRRATPKSKPAAGSDHGKTPGLVRPGASSMGIRPDQGLAVAKCPSCGGTINPVSLDCRCTR